MLYLLFRYLCIISRDKHLIIEDAVVTAAGINHNVLGTWSQLIAQAMKYGEFCSSFKSLFFEEHSIFKNLTAFDPAFANEIK